MPPKTKTPLKLPAKQKAHTPTKFDFRKSKNVNSVSRNPTIRIYSFTPPFAFEAIKYETKEGQDGYMHNYRLYVKDSFESEALKTANFTDIMWQRNVDDPEGGILKNKNDGFWRSFAIRYPTENLSTPATRQTGMNAMKTFCMHKSNSRYPPKDIQLIDMSTREISALPALDDLFQDMSIEKLMKIDIEDSALDPHFYNDYPELAKKCWSRPTTYPFAHFLGFP